MVAFEACPYKKRCWKRAGQMKTCGYVTIYVTNL